MRNNYDSLLDFHKEIERIEATKNDYLVPSKHLRMVEDDKLKIDKIGEFGINDLCHGQICEKLPIPKKYYDSMATIPGLRTLNVNAWIREQGNTQFIRTLDGNARAFLSDRYHAMDNYDVLTHSIFPSIKDLKEEIMLKALSISETRMYIQFSVKSLEAEVTVGDIVRYGLTISNSEVGLGGLNAEGWLERLACDNGMVRNSLFKKYHVSRRLEEGSDVWKRDTIKKELETYQLQLRDVIQHALSKESFDSEVNQMKGAAGDKVDNIVETVQNVTKRFGLSEKDGEFIIQNMSETNNLSRWGVANGITAMAHDAENPDRQYQLEKLGSQVIDLSPNDWKVIAA